MLLHIANYTEANRLTVTAGAALPLGGIHKIVNVGGVRTAQALADADAALLVEGNYGLSFKVSTDPFQVSTSTAPSFTGVRTVAIASGDLMVSVVGAYVEIDPSLLDASLDPARAGAAPVPGQTLAIKSGLICGAAVAGAITTPVVARCHYMNGTRPVIHISETAK
jgi:hypothetical protein